MPHDAGPGHALDRMPMVTARSVMAELVRALAVLAIVFLSFAYQPAVAAHDGYASHAAGHDLCGGPPGDDTAAHAPCHACRADPAVLPPPPCAADPAFGVVAADMGGSTDVPAVLLQRRSPAHPRAPPSQA